MPLTTFGILNGYKNDSYPDSYAFLLIWLGHDNGPNLGHRQFQLRTAWTAVYFPIREDSGHHAHSLFIQDFLTN